MISCMHKKEIVGVRRELAGTQMVVPRPDLSSDAGVRVRASGHWCRQVEVLALRAALRFHTKSSLALIWTMQLCGCYMGYYKEGSLALPKREGKAPGGFADVSRHESGTEMTDRCHLLVRLHESEGAQPGPQAQRHHYLVPSPPVAGIRMRS